MVVVFRVFGILGFLGSLELSEIGVFWVFKVLGLIMYLRIPLGDALGSRMPWECLGMFGNAQLGAKTLGLRSAVGSRMISPWGWTRD